MGAVLGMVYVWWIYTIITDKTRIPLQSIDSEKGVDAGGVVSNDNSICAENGAELDNGMEDPEKDRDNNDKKKSPREEPVNSETENNFDTAPTERSLSTTEIGTTNEEEFKEKNVLVKICAKVLSILP